MSFFLNQKWVFGQSPLTLFGRLNFGTWNDLLRDGIRDRIYLTVHEKPCGNRNRNIAMRCIEIAGDAGI